MEQKATIESITAKIIIPARSRASSTASSKRSTKDSTDGTVINSNNHDKKLKKSVDTTNMPAPSQRQQPSANSQPKSRYNSVTATTDQANDELTATASSITEQHRQQQRSTNERLQEQI